VIKTYDTEYDGTEESVVGTAFDTKSYQWTTNPNTSAAWTWDEIDALQIGVDLKGDGSSSAYLTQVYASVSYEAAPVTEGDVPTGDLFNIIFNSAYPGDLQAKVYLANTAALTKAYQHLNMKLYLEDSVEAGETPNYQLLTLNNGMATFNLKDVAGHL